MKPNCRRGFSYIAVLGTSLIVGTMALGSLNVLRIQSRLSQNAIQSIKARQDARTAVELGGLLLNNDAAWRASLSNGKLLSSRSTGNGLVDVTIHDPLDKDLGNNPHHAIRMNITATQGRAIQKFQVDLSASPKPLDFLENAIHTWTGLRVRPGGELAVYGAPVGTHGSLTNDAVIDGDVVATKVSKLGSITGSLKTSAPILDLPTDSVVTKFMSVGTQFTNRPNLIEKSVISPGFNPFGPLNAAGVYIVRPTSNMIIRNTRIHGTLIVVMSSNGNRVTIGENVFFQPAVPGYPALIVAGNLELAYRSDGEELSESGLNTNFNPAGAPDNGVSDSDTIDTYPSEIHGLIYVTRRLTWNNNGLLRGGLYVEGQGSNPGIEIYGTPRVLYDPYLFFNPSPWFTKRVDMVLQRGTWQQVVE